MYVPCVGLQYVREVSLKQTGELDCKFEGEKKVVTASMQSIKIYMISFMVFSLLKVKESFMRSMICLRICVSLFQFLKQVL
jgi:hypothetical protein